MCIGLLFVGPISDFVYVNTRVSKWNGMRRPLRSQFLLRALALTFPQMYFMGFSFQKTGKSQSQFCDSKHLENAAARGCFVLRVEL